jgi:diguanylate cyclase (GGDEF)-like protein
VHGHLRLLIGTACVLYLVVFAAFLVFERPGMGIGHGFYIPIALLAVVSGPRIGAAAGVMGAALYSLAVMLNPNVPTIELVTVSTPVRLITYTGVGALVGWFAQRNRDLIQQLEVLAERDRLTGLPNMRAFEAAVDRRFHSGDPFAVLLGDMDGLRELNEEQGHGGGDTILVRLAETLGKLILPEEELARVGGDEFAILVSARGKEAAAQRANLLEARLADDGLVVTFGWAAFPEEGANALSLIRVADERLYARKLVRGRRQDAPQQPTLGIG